MGALGGPRRERGELGGGLGGGGLGAEGWEAEGWEAEGWEARARAATRSKELRRSAESKTMVVIISSSATLASSNSVMPRLTVSGEPTICEAWRSSTKVRSSSV